MSTSTLTPRQSFRDVLAQVAEQAKALLPEQVNGRIESAATLVLQGDVFFKDDGTVEVGSSDPARAYTLVGTTCSCKDFTDGRAPEGWCKHRVAANLQRSVERVLARRGVPVEPPLEPWPDNDPEDEPAPAPVPSEPAREPAGQPALPEAPASVNVRLTIGGREVQWTLRDTDEARLAVRLEELLQRYPLPQPPAASHPGSGPGQLSPQQQNAAAMHKAVDGFCKVHQVEMQENHKDGRTWFSHKTDEGWCKGR